MAGNTEPSDQNEPPRYSFEAIYDQFNNRLRGFIKQKFREKIWERGEAEDILSNTWLSIVKNWRTVGALPSEASLWSYLRRTAHNKCIDFIRRDHSNILLNNPEHELEDMLSSDEDMEEHILNRDEFERIVELTVTLSERECRCLLLSLAGKEITEVANIMNLSVVIVRTLRREGIKKCRTYILNHPEYIQERGEYHGHFRL